jgi:hypothetical protein
MLLSLTNMSPEQVQLHATITALESQRAVLGDVVVDMAVAPLRAKLEALSAPPPPPPAPPPPEPRPASPEVAVQSLKQVTILFLDMR